MPGAGADSTVSLGAAGAAAGGSGILSHRRFAMALGRRIAFSRLEQGKMVGRLERCVLGIGLRPDVTNVAGFELVAFRLSIGVLCWRRAASYGSCVRRRETASPPAPAAPAPACAVPAVLAGGGRRRVGGRSG